MPADFTPLASGPVPNLSVLQDIPIFKHRPGPGRERHPHKRREKGRRRFAAAVGGAWRPANRSSTAAWSSCRARHRMLVANLRTGSLSRWNPGQAASARPRLRVLSSPELLHRPDVDGNQPGRPVVSSCRVRCSRAYNVHQIVLYSTYYVTT